MPPRERERVKKAIALLMERGFRDQSLHVKRIKGTAHIWEVRVNLACRMPFQIEEDTIVLRNVGAHDATLDRP